LGGGINTYSYALQNPLAVIDEEGLCGRMPQPWEHAVYPATENCSCVLNCMKKKETPVACRLIPKPKAGKPKDPPGEKRPPGTPKPSSGLKIPGIQEICAEIVNRFECDSECSKFCETGKGPSPYPK
jgi:hypothetical protein